MTKISIYNIDENVTGSDKWIGSDAQSQYATKNFTPTKLANYFNENQVIDIGTPIRYRYDILEIEDSRLPGTITFDPQVGTPYSFSNITTFLLSKYTLKGNDVTEYLNFLIGTKVLINKSSDVNKFGYFSVTNIEEYLPEPNFFQVTLSYITGNGSIEEDRDYLISLVDVVTPAPIPTLDEVTTAGNTTGNSIILTNPYNPDYILTNTLTSLNSYYEYISGTQTNYTADYAGYGTYLTSVFEGEYRNASIDINGINADWNKLLESGSVNLNPGGPGLGGGKITFYDNNTFGSIRINNITANTILEFPNKPAGTYTIATTADISGGVTDVTATSPITSSGGTTPVISTSMATNKLIGRATSGVGVMEEITLGTGLSLTGNTLNASAVITPAALTKTDDTNITLTLGGSPSTALLEATSLTLGWTGTLADGRIASASTWNAKEPGITAGTTNQYWRGDKTWQILPTVPTKTSQLINDGDDGNTHFISLEDLPSNLTLYATNAASDISTYYKLVTSITDTSYNTTAVNIPTGAITTVNQFISSLITSPNVIAGNPGVFNITTIGNIQRLSGTGNAEFYFEVWKRVAAGTETLITTSNNTLPVLNSGYAEFSATALWNDGVFLSTDRIVLKYYASRVAGGSNPSYQFQFGGISPVRSLVPIPLNVVPVIKLDDLQDVTITSVANNEILTWEAASNLWKNKTVVSALGFTPYNDTNPNGYTSNLGTVTSVAALTLGTTGTDLTSTVANGTTTPVITLNVPDASATARGVITTGVQTIAGAKTFSPSVTASGLIAQGTIFTPTLIASANNDILVGLDITPTFTNGAFTGVTNNLFRARTSLGITRTSLNNLGIQSWVINSGSSEVGTLSYSTPSNRIGIVFQNVGLTGRSDIRHISTGGITIAATTTASNPTDQFFFYPTGNFGINQATDNGGKLQVKAGGALSTDIALRVRNSADTADLALINGLGNLLIGTSTNIASSKLTVESTTQGLLPPRMTTTQKNAIVTPASGLVVYDTTLGKLCVRGAAAWETITSI